MLSLFNYSLPFFIKGRLAFGVVKSKNSEIKKRWNQVTMEKEYADHRIRAKAQLSWYAVLPQTNCTQHFYPTPAKQHEHKA